MHEAKQINTEAAFQGLAFLCIVMKQTNVLTLSGNLSKF